MIIVYRFQFRWIFGGKGVLFLFIDVPEEKLHEINNWFLHKKKKKRSC